MYSIARFFRALHLPNRFFIALGVAAVVTGLGFGVPMLFPIGQTMLALVAVLLFADVALLFRFESIVEGGRRLPKVLSLGDDNPVHLTLRSSHPLRLSATVIDELPMQFQRRNFALHTTLPPNENIVLHYPLRPTTRGGYGFGNVQVFCKTPLGMAVRCVTIAGAHEVPVYPSILQMKKFELRAFARISTLDGIKKQRRLGHSYEFEQIKNYVRGDDYRSINWKATSRHSELMVNQYEDERAQQIYCIIDKSRVMRMPFAELSLMDYAINTALVISNIALKKHDRAGLITFSAGLGSAIKAERKPDQLHTILHALYKEREQPQEANYELLYNAVSRLINGRSLLFLYTNFESMYALERVLPLLRRINRMHLLVVVFFKNTEIATFAQTPANTLEGVYEQTTAQKSVMEKTQIVQKLRQFGIQAILTEPENLSLNTVNKYLELKSRGFI